MQNLAPLVISFSLLLPAFNLFSAENNYPAAVRFKLAQGNGEQVFLGEGDPSGKTFVYTEEENFAEIIDSGKSKLLKKFGCKKDVLAKVFKSERETAPVGNVLIAEVTEGTKLNFLPSKKGIVKSSSCCATNSYTHERQGPEVFEIKGGKLLFNKFRTPENADCRPGETKEDGQCADYSQYEEACELKNNKCTLVFASKPKEFGGDSVFSKDIHLHSFRGTVTITESSGKVSSLFLFESENGFAFLPEGNQPKQSLSSEASFTNCN